MKIFSSLKRYVLWLPETLLCGPSYAQFFFTSRNTRPLDANLVWQRFTQEKSQLVEWFFKHYPPAAIRRFWALLYPRLRDRVKGISAHYDVSNDFYRLFLDRDYMFYTCADFLRPDDSLETAQKQKADFILNLIDPKPGERILDLGCGWGSMLKRVYEKTQDKEHLHGYTLAAEQQRFIEENYGFNVHLKDVINSDYESEYWDKIYSIGCMEHIPKADLLPLAKTLKKAIKPDGKIVHHFFCQMSSAPPPKLLAGGADVFPGIELATWKEHVKTFDDAGLRVLHHSIHDYRPTLTAWYNRLAAQKDRAIQLVGTRTYNRYLCYLAEAWRLFDDRDLLLMRFVLMRQDAPTLWQSTLYDVDEIPAREKILQSV